MIYHLYPSFFWKVVQMDKTKNPESRWMIFVFDIFSEIVNYFQLFVATVSENECCTPSLMVSCFVHFNHLPKENI